MKCNSRRKKQSFFEQKPIVSTFMFVLFFIAFMFLDNYPSLQPMRDSWIYIIISKAAISGVILYFTWLRKKRPPIFEKIAVSIFALLPWAPLFIKSGRAILLVQMILFYILLIIFIKHFSTDKKYTTVTNAVTLFIGMIIILSVKDYTYLHNSEGIHFWEIALIIALLVAAVFTILMVNNIIKLEDDRTSERIMAPILVLGMTFILVAFTISNLNYSLDFSKPVDYAATVLEKRIDTGYRSPTDYVFSANVNGEEKEFNVTQSEYFHKNIGDSFSVRLYQGAFGHEYYIYSYVKGREQK